MPHFSGQGGFRNSYRTGDKALAALQWFLKPDSLTVNSDHAIVLASAIASIEIWRRKAAEGGQRAGLPRLAGELRQLPAKFVKPVQAVTKAVNCVKCSHAHLLIKPQSSSQVQKSAEEALALIAVNGKQPEDASEHPAEAAVA
jgi:hypothetical protein